MIEPEWNDQEVVLAIHEAQIAEHGGLRDLRDGGLLESALARPCNLFHYSSQTVTPHQLAAAYAYGLARNHAFLDGNKRVAWVVCALFLELNGFRVVAEQIDVLEVMLALAQGKIEEAELAVWLAEPTVTVTDPSL